MSTRTLPLFVSLIIVPLLAACGRSQSPPSQSDIANAFSFAIHQKMKTSGVLNSSAFIPKITVKNHGCKPVKVGYVCHVTLDRHGLLRNHVQTLWVVMVKRRDGWRVITK